MSEVPSYQRLALDPLRDDPRMQRLMEALGLPNGYNPEADT
jgi:hypothetical protein